MKQVRETKAGGSISAYVVLRATGEHVATVQAHFADSGNVMVDVWHMGADNPTRAAREARKDYGPDQRRAGGGGYDKFTACLGGIEIDGHRLADHSGNRLPLPDGCDAFPEGFKPPPGYTLANWRREGGGYTSCFQESGLRYLESLGYIVVQAI